MRCFICHMPLYLTHHGICDQCCKNMPKTATLCRICGLPHSTIKPYCYRCRENLPNWDELVVVSDYIDPLKKLIHALKFQRKIQLSIPLARLMFLAWYQRRVEFSLPKPDIVTCVPLHHFRYWTRGFNQSECFAKPISKWLDCAYLPHLLTRKRNQQDQKKLKLNSRKTNVKNQFSCQSPLNNKRIMLIDDIVTTGNTINEISKLLKQQGAINIQVICLCRTIL